MLNKQIEDEIVAAITSDKTLAKHIDYRHWISGSSTVVYPIALWLHDITIQIDTRRNVFEKCIKRILEKNKHLFQYGYFRKSDGSCPSSITFRYTDEVTAALHGNN